MKKQKQEIIKKYNKIKEVIPKVWRMDELNKKIVI